MRVVNIHSRFIHQSKDSIGRLMRTLSSRDDKVWPLENWPEMRFKEGMKTGALGGHGGMKYVVEKFEPDDIIQFRFLKPGGFLGIHKFEMIELTENCTEFKHTIDMRLNLRGIVLWYLVVRLLHNALMEDCLDKVERYFNEYTKPRSYGFLVNFLRSKYKISNNY